MARLARAVFPGHPHHVTQRGNGRATTFFDDEDYARYRDLLGQHCAAAGVEIWAWVLMPNHVHLILVPSDADCIRHALAAVHRRYAGYVHAKLKRTGHFWQGRFGCVAMDEAHLGAALRYVALNPVRAKLVRHAADWPWSSLHAQLGADDGLTTTTAVATRYPDFAALIAAGEDAEGSRRLRQAETIGRPIGASAFIERLERESGRTLASGKRGRPRKENGALSP
jgi:putative transposase